MALCNPLSGVEQETDLLEGHRILMRRARAPQPVRSIPRSLRPYLLALHAADYVCVAFDWVAFEAVATLTELGEQRLERDRISNLSPLREATNEARP